MGDQAASAAFLAQLPDVQEWVAKSAVAPVVQVPRPTTVSPIIPPSQLTSSSSSSRLAPEQPVEFFGAWPSPPIMLPSLLTPSSALAAEQPSEDDMMMPREEDDLSTVVRSVTVSSPLQQETTIIALPKPNDAAVADNKNDSAQQQLRRPGGKKGKKNKAANCVGARAARKELRQRKILGKHAEQKPSQGVNLSRRQRERAIAANAPAATSATQATPPVEGVVSSTPQAEENEAKNEKNVTTDDSSPDLVYLSPDEREAYAQGNPLLAKKDDKDDKTDAFAMPVEDENFLPKLATETIVEAAASVAIDKKKQAFANTMAKHRQGRQSRASIKRMMDSDPAATKGLNDKKLMNEIEKMRRNPGLVLDKLNVQDPEIRRYCESLMQQGKFQDLANEFLKHAGA